jgi:hypothetical protein
LDEKALKYAPLGINYVTKKLLSEPMDEDDFTKNIVKRETTRGGRPKGGDSLSALSEKPPRPGIKWNFIVHEDDPHLKEIAKIIKPLADLRNESNHLPQPESPLRFYGNSLSEWRQWLRRCYDNLPDPIRPNYLLIVGDPQQIPFAFQSLLDLDAKVGRVCFDSLDELENYVEKVIRLKKHPPALKKEATFFAPNWGKNENGKLDPTHYSHTEMIVPLSEYLQQKNISSDITTADTDPKKDATKTNLKDKLVNSKSALVYVASHGLGLVESAKQKELTGAICCQNWNNTQDGNDLFKASDIPYDEPTKSFLEGAVFVQFSCFGYGTPKFNDIVNFSFSGLQQPQQIADDPIISSIPKKLLAHPKGPVAFVGHVNVTYLEGFYDDNVATPPEERRSLRPYTTMLDHIFAKATLGEAMDDMNVIAAREASMFKEAIGEYQQGNVDRAKKKEISKSFLLANDLENFMVFGDPAVSVTF